MRGEVVLACALILVPAAARAQDGKTPRASDVAPVDSLLATFEKESEPARSVKRVFTTALYYLLERDIERYLACFHKDYELSESGAIKPLPLAEHRARVLALWEKVPKATARLDELVALEKARAYSKEQAKRWIGDWKKEPSEIAKVMKEGDWLVIAPLKARGTDFESEVYYVLRQEGGAWKIVLGE